MSAPVPMFFAVQSEAQKFVGLIANIVQEKWHNQT